MEYTRWDNIDKSTEIFLNDNDYAVYDDIVDQELATKVYKTLLDPFFPWYLSRTLYTVPIEEMYDAKNKYDNLKEYIQFVHTFFDDNKGADTTANSAYTELSIDILQKFLNRFLIDKIELFRCKANFQTQHGSNDPSLHNTPHRDMQRVHIVMLYYVNDSDGDTILFKDDKEFARISPKQGRILLFKGSLLHSGAHPYKSDARLVINYNFNLK